MIRIADGKFKHFRFPGRESGYPGQAPGIILRYDDILRFLYEDVFLQLLHSEGIADHVMVIVQPGPDVIILGWIAAFDLHIVVAFRRIHRKLRHLGNGMAFRRAVAQDNGNRCKLKLPCQVKLRTRNIASALRLFRPGILIISHSEGIAGTVQTVGDAVIAADGIVVGIAVGKIGRGAVLGNICTRPAQIFHLLRLKVDSPGYGGPIDAHGIAVAWLCGETVIGSGGADVKRIARNRLDLIRAAGISSPNQVFGVDIISMRCGERIAP